jgi:hypothetical protein
MSALSFVLFLVSVGALTWLLCRLPIGVPALVCGCLAALAIWAASDEAYFASGMLIVGAIAAGWLMVECRRDDLRAGAAGNRATSSGTSRSAHR